MLVRASRSAIPLRDTPGGVRPRRPRSPWTGQAVVTANAEQALAEDDVRAPPTGSLPASASPGRSESPRDRIADAPTRTRRPAGLSRAPPRRGVGLGALLLAL